MFCIHCGVKVPVDARFCRGCGARITDGDESRSSLEQSGPAANHIAAGAITSTELAAGAVTVTNTAVRPAVTVESKQSPRECPNCRLWSRPGARTCDCGYDFVSGRTPSQDHSTVTAASKDASVSPLGWMTLPLRRYSDFSGRSRRKAGLDVLSAWLPRLGRIRFNCGHCGEPQRRRKSQRSAANRVVDRSARVLRRAGRPGVGCSSSSPTRSKCKWLASPLALRSVPWRLSAANSDVSGRYGGA